MVEQVEQRLGRAPEQWLVDGGFPPREQIDSAARKTTVYAPVPERMVQKDEQGKTVPQDKHEPKAADSAAVAGWCQRMASDKQRMASAECVNARTRLVDSRACPRAGWRR